MIILTNREQIDQFMSNNNVTLFVDYYEHDSLTITNREQIDQFINTIDFDCEVSTVNFQHRVEYFNIEFNHCDLTDRINEIDPSKVFVINVDSMFCDCYFVIN